MILRYHLGIKDQSLKLLCQNIHMKYECFDDEKRIFGQTIWLLHSFLRNLNTKRLISPERNGFRGSNFVRFILGIYIYIGMLIQPINSHFRKGKVQKHRDQLQQRRLVGIRVFCIDFINNGRVKFPPAGKSQIRDYHLTQYA